MSREALIPQREAPAAEAGVTSPAAGYRPPNLAHEPFPRHRHRRRAGVLHGRPAVPAAPARGRPRRRRSPDLARPHARPAVRGARLGRGGRPRGARARPARRRAGGARHGLRRRRRAAAGRDRDLRAAARLPRPPGVPVPHRRRPPPRGREVRRAQDPQVVPKKLVLAVIDSLKPELLDQAVAEGEAPALKALLDCGTYIRDCVSTFPSVTPVASAAIATGCGPGEHHIPSMNWFHRGEERYVEYGSSLPATRAFGIVRSLYDTVYNMNLAHLSRAHKTVFEHLDDAGL